eukprot:9029456-Pyramimonas_sp.AAC.1
MVVDETDRRRLALPGTRTGHVITGTTSPLLTRLGMFITGAGKGAHGPACCCPGSHGRAAGTCMFLAYVSSAEVLLDVWLRGFLNA